ncbi:MAG: lytic transglycosylase domain-containing protein [Bacteroidetes bacterium]|nr:lytic transglycosylase domain-containing protein [Bacteroidota bacterium]
MNNRTVIIIFSSVNALLLAIIIILITMRSNKEPETIKEFNRNSFDLQIKSVSIPAEIDFAGEPTPLHLYYVQEHLEWELTVNTYWHSSTLLNLKRSARWFPVIEPILAEYNIPEDFKYLSLIESAFQNVTSPAGAVGFWQFMKGTARDYGLEVTTEVDERYHVEKATVAACKYFNKAYKKYQNWTMVAAAYNAGNRGVDRQIERQKETAYYDLLLNEETERYVFRILALKSIIINPEAYGFYMEEKDYYQVIPYKMVEVNTAISSWTDFAKSHQINYRLLKEFNPWLRQADLKNRRKKTYQIKIPKLESL